MNWKCVGRSGVQILVRTRRLSPLQNIQFISSTHSGSNFSFFSGSKIASADRLTTHNRLESSLNHTHYVKCGVKKFICHKILAAAYALWHIGSLFYQNTQRSQRRRYIKNSFLCDIPQNKAPHTRPTSHLGHLQTVPFLWPPEGHRPKRRWVNNFAGHCLLWRLLLRLAAVPPPPSLSPFLLLLFFIFLFPLFFF